MRRSLAACLVLLLCPACADPVHTEAVDALGSEVPGVPEGPLHRPGQPCLTCHGGEGPGEPELSFAGTVYSAPKGGVPVAGARVRIVDAEQHVIDRFTNCAGNFFLRADEFVASFPAITAVTTTGTLVMRTEMHRSGDCNSCHSATPGASSPGLVWAQTLGLPVCADE